MPAFRPFQTRCFRQYPELFWKCSFRGQSFSPQRRARTLPPFECFLHFPIRLSAESTDPHPGVEHSTTIMRRSGAQPLQRPVLLRPGFPPSFTPQASQEPPVPQ